MTAGIGEIKSNQLHLKLGVVLLIAPISPQRLDTPDDVNDPGQDDPFIDGAPVIAL